MKQLTTTFNGLLKKAKSFCLAIGMLLLSAQGFSQDPGGSPDGPPPAVPFNDYYHLILIAVGGIFALLVIKRMQKKQTTKL